MTIDEVLERLKRACLAGEWSGAGALLEYWINDSDFSGDRYYVVYGFVYGMLCAGLITDEEHDLIVKTMIQRRIGKIEDAFKKGGGSG